MPSDVQPWVLVEHLFDTSVGPERLGELIAAWDAQLGPPGPVRLSDSAGTAFAQQVAGVLQILEQLQAAELRRVDDLLSSLLGAAMVLAADGSVVAANEAAATAFGLRPGGSIRSLPLPREGLDELCARIAEIATGPGHDREAILGLRPEGLDRTVLVHLKPMRGGLGPAHVLAVTSEIAWSAAVTAFLARNFGLTPAEVDVVRHLAAGGTVAGIAAATRRSPGTVRSQLHAVLQKTGTRSQAEVVRLAILLMQSVPAEAAPRRPPPTPEPHQRFLRMADGRRIEVLTFGDPVGRPVIWMQSTYGFWRLPASAEADLARRRLRVIVPFRAGWCGSDPLPKGRNALEVAVADLRELMAQLRIASAPVVAPGDDLRIALMLAQAEPDRVRHVLAIGAGFPIRDETQYRRLMPIARFVRACARHRPQVLGFMIRGVRPVISLYGIDRYLKGLVAGVPADTRAMADPEVAAAFHLGVEKQFFGESWSEASFCTELPLFHEDWPEALGQVACPVTLIHGEQDGNAPFETALDYCALHPAWRYVAYPDEGELVAHVRWRDVFDLIESALAPAVTAAPGPGPAALAD